MLMDLWRRQSRVPRMGGEEEGEHEHGAFARGLLFAGHHAKRPGMVGHAYNPSTWEAEAEGPRV
jgi:hypothetical protein